MRRHLTLVRLFWQHLIRRKSLWVVVALVGVVLLVNIAIQSQLKNMLQDGVRYDIATRRASASLDQFAGQIRQGAAVLAVIVGALLAPAARKEGTTQFALTLSVSRLELALAQFGALALFVFLGTVVVHVGYCVAAYRLDILGVGEALLGWATLLLPVLLLAAASFCLSLTRPALMVYAILLGMPYMAMPILGSFLGAMNERAPVLLRLGAARVIDNLGLLFPNLESLILWPRIWITTSPRPPHPAWGWEAGHQLAALALWGVVGLWAYRRLDLGSRIPTK
jgi:ABC-type transport system involved in multi-copper enzyme maturation permease subunit